MKNKIYHTVGTVLKTSKCFTLSMYFNRVNRKL